jgi:Brp/Blh family beta-carotene 15,15'-monooxygenase
MRLILLFIGFLSVLIYKQMPFQLSDEAQIYLFISGVLLLGVPHGAADLLVAEASASRSTKYFSPFRFLSVYILRLCLFGLVFWFFPVLGNLLFVLFAAYHFGETDLHRFKTDTWMGKFFVVGYGLLILGFILLHHFDQLIPLFSLFSSGRDSAMLISQIDANRYLILGIILFLFLISAFVYFSRHEVNSYDSGVFLVHLALILSILYFLPMMLAFTFYFIIWHSLLSLQNILSYLTIEKKFTKQKIAKQIAFYSMLALIGIGLAGTGGFVFVHGQTLLVYVFLGLAVLTAPHMQVMHEMYNKIRQRQKVVSA